MRKVFQATFRKLPRPLFRLVPPKQNGKEDRPNMCQLHVVVTVLYQRSKYFSNLEALENPRYVLCSQLIPGFADFQWSIRLINPTIHHITAINYRPEE